MNITITGTRAAKIIGAIGAILLVITWIAVKDAEEQRARADSLAATIATVLAREKVMVRCTTADNTHVCSPEEYEKAEQARDSLRKVFAQRGLSR